jgi:hypothetical protein
MYLALVFTLGTEMHYFKKNHDSNNKSNSNNNHHLIAVVATIFTLAVIITSSTVATGAATATIATATTPSAPSSGMIELSPQPVYQEQEKLESQTPINETHFEVVVSGNGTLTLPNGTETITTTSTRTGLVRMEDGSFSGKQVLTTEDGSESATATFYEIARFNMESGEGRGIAIAVFDTNSTGRLAALNGMILTGIDELHPDETGLVTLWEWHSGIPLPNMNITTGEGSSS